MIKKHLILVIISLLLVATSTEVVVIDEPSPPTSGADSHSPLMLTALSEVDTSVNPRQILKVMAVPGYARRHGFNHIVLGTWNCKGELSGNLRLWNNPIEHLQDTIAEDNG